MKQEFLDAYERELGILYERVDEFAATYPGVAERLGGLTRDKLDPGLGGLLEGAAFLAARVQTKIDSEFSTFTTALLDQVLPDFLAPIPSAMIAQATPNFSDRDLAKGVRFPRGSYLDADYVERDQRISCRFRLSSALELWPLHLAQGAYFSGPAPLQALGLEVADGTLGGLRLSFFHRTAQAMTDPDSDAARAAPPVSTIGVDTLPVHLHGAMSDMVTLYEQLLANCARITLRWLDENGDPVFMPAPADMIEPLGFREEEALYPEDGRVFSGFALLREYMTLPQKFLGVRLNGLARLLGRIPAPAFDILIEFNRVHPRLGATVSAANFRLYAAPALNLFEERCARVKIGPEHNEYLVTPSSFPQVNFEIHRVLSVDANFLGQREKAPVWPIYALPPDSTKPDEALYFATRRRPRRLTPHERRFGAYGDYLGTETLVSLHEPARIDSAYRVQSLQVRALCSNRHLPAQLPVGRGAADFHLRDDVTVPIGCITGPTLPRESVLESETDSPRLGRRGERLWRLVSFLSFNQFGLQDRHSGDPAAGLREVLSLCAGTSDAVTETQIQGLRGVSSRPVVRMIRRADGFAPARGIEVTLGFDERNFEGSGIALLGSVLDRFLADYVTVNSFTETVIRSERRGEVMRFAPRSGTGPVL